MLYPLSYEGNGTNVRLAADPHPKVRCSNLIGSSNRAAGGDVTSIRPIGEDLRVTMVGSE